MKIVTAPFVAAVNRTPRGWPVSILERMAALTTGLMSEKTVMVAWMYFMAVKENFLHVCVKHDKRLKQNRERAGRQNKSIPVETNPLP